MLRSSSGDDGTPSEDGGEYVENAESVTEGNVIPEILEEEAVE